MAESLPKLHKYKLIFKLITQTQKHKNNQPFFIHAVSGWASRKLKQNEQNIDIYITANRSFYPILFDMEK